jgi:hypothetical protein
MSLRNFERMRHGMFSRAIIKNVVKEPAWRARLNTAFIHFACAQPPVKSDIPFKRLYEKPEMNPATQRYWEHTYGLQTSPAGTDPWLIELARVNIPQSLVGIVKSLEQFVFHPDIQGNTFYSASANWGNPHVLPLATVTIRWLFRLERGDTPEPPQLNYSGTNPIVPGEPHFELPEMTELWFPSASPVSQNFHLTIGGRYRLRLFALLEWTAEFSLGISAKMRGFRLSPFDKLTLKPLRSVW